MSDTSLHRIAILTALAEYELPAVLTAFGLSPDSCPHETIDTERYWYASVQSSNRSTLKIVISCAGHSGNAEVQVPTERLIRNHDPEFVLLVGIACGVNCELGDVAVSSGVWAYEYVKTSPGHELDRSRMAVVSDPVERTVQHFRAEDHWQALFRRTQALIPDPTLRSQVRPKLHKDIWFASGEKVMGAGELQQLNAKHDRIRVGEMEGYGFARTCERRQRPVPWLIVRGISDHGDPSKDAPGAGDAGPLKDEYHMVAAVTAASLARSFLENGYEPIAHDAAEGGATRDGGATQDGRRDAVPIPADDDRTAGAAPPERPLRRMFLTALGAVALSGAGGLLGRRLGRSEGRRLALTGPSETIASFRARITPAGVDRFDREIRDHHLGRENHYNAAGDVHQSWFVARDLVIAIRTYQSLTFGSEEFRVGTAPTLDSTVLGRSFAIEPGGSFVVHPAGHPVHANGVLLNVGIVQAFAERVTDGNFFLFDVDKFEGGGRFSFDVSILRSLGIVPRPHLATVESDDGATLEEVVFHGRELGQKDSMAARAVELVAVLTQALKREPKATAEVREQLRLLGIVNSPIAEFFDDPARVLGPAADYVQFSGNVDGTKDAIFVYYLNRSTPAP